MRRPPGPRSGVRASLPVAILTLCSLAVPALTSTTATAAAASVGATATTAATVTGGAELASPRTRTAAEQRAEAIVVAVTNAARAAPREVVPEATEPSAPALRGWTDLRDVARGWSDRMAADGRLGHNPSYASQLCCWSALAENVAYRTGVHDRPSDAVARDLAVQLLRSPSHRAAALDPRFEEVGVGVSIRGDRMYVTMDLRRRQPGTTPPGGPWHPTASPPAPPTPDPTIRAACPAAVSLPVPFTDVSGGPHAQPIACAVAWGVVTGRTAEVFAPSGQVTRAQVASMLHRLLTTSGVRFDDRARVRFTDVTHGPHRDAIELLAGAGVIRGTGGGRFAPDAPVRRDQLASLVVRSLEHGHGLVPPLGPRFPDVAASSTHGDAVRRLAGAGITQGDGAGRFRPAAAVRRDQMATFAMRAADLLVREDHTAPPPPARP